MHPALVATLHAVDPEIADLIAAEERRQRDKIRLIASENYVSGAVLAASGSVLTNKYSEGYPGKRYYGGNQIIDEVEDLARALYGEDENPADVTRTEAPYTFEKMDGFYAVKLKLPFAVKGEIGLFKKGDELVVEIGTLRRHIGLQGRPASQLTVELFPCSGSGFWRPPAYRRQRQARYLSYWR